MKQELILSFQQKYRFAHRFSETDFIHSFVSKIYIDASETEKRYFIEITMENLRFPIVFFNKSKQNLSEDHTLTPFEGRATAQLNSERSPNSNVVNDQTIRNFRKK